MAEFLTFGAQELLKKVASMAAQEFDLVWGFNGEITKLRESVLMLEAVLQDAEHPQQDQGEAVKLWMKKLEDIAQHADDVLDDYGYELLRRKVQLRNQMKKKLQDKYVPTDMSPVAEDFFCSSSKGSGASIPRFLNFCVETRGIFHCNVRLFSCGLQENPGLDSIMVSSQQVPFQKTKLSVCAFEVAFKVLHEKQIKRKCVLQSSIVDFSHVLLLYSKATHSHQIRLLRIVILGDV